MSKSHKVQWPTMFSGLRGSTWANFPREISAGITLAALIIPLNIGYAQVAGLPPVFGLYAGIIPLAIFAIFTSSRHVVGSPDAPIELIGENRLYPTNRHAIAAFRQETGQATAETTVK